MCTFLTRSSYVRGDPGSKLLPAAHKTSLLNPFVKCIVLHHFVVVLCQLAHFIVLIYYIIVFSIPTISHLGAFLSKTEREVKVKLRE